MASKNAMLRYKRSRKYAAAMAKHYIRKMLESGASAAEVYGLLTEFL